MWGHGFFAKNTDWVERFRGIKAIRLALRIHPSTKGQESSTLEGLDLGWRFGGVDVVTLFRDLPTRRAGRYILYLLHGVLG
jgi:hypothetical protein